MAKNIIAGTVIAGAMTLQNADAQTNSAEGIRPFKIQVSNKELNDLKKRIESTKWPDPEIVKDESQGVQFATTETMFQE